IPFVVRSRVISCMSTSRPSAVSLTSISQAVAPPSRALRRAARVFSGAWRILPRCPQIRIGWLAASLRSVMDSPLLISGQPVAQGVAEDGDAERDGKDQRAGEHGQPPFGEQIVAPVAEHAAKAGERRLDAHADKAQ